MYNNELKHYSIDKSKEMSHSTISEYRNAVLKLVFNQGVKYSKTYSMPYQHHQQVIKAALYPTVEILKLSDI